MDKVWIRKSINEWISIDIDEIKSFSHLNFHLYINNKLIVRDNELILFKALEKLFKGGRGSKYPFDDSVSQYNKLIKGVSDDKS